MGDLDSNIVEPTLAKALVDLACLRVRAIEIVDLMKVNISALFVAFALCLTPQIGFGAKGELKKVTRVESVIAEKKGRKIVVHVDGMAPTTASLFGNNGQLVRHGSELKANKDGLLEYDLCFKV